MRKVETKTARKLSKNQKLISLITTSKLSPTTRPAFKIEEYVANLSKREWKDYIMIIVIYLLKLKIRLIWFWINTKSYAHRTSVVKVCKKELLEHVKTNKLNLIIDK